MAMDVEQTDDPASVLERAHDHLVGRPVHHNLILTLLHGRVARPEPGRYWLVCDGDVVGVGFQSPVDYVATVTPMSPEAADALTSAIVAAGGTVPGVQGEAATAARIAGTWTELTGSAAVPRMGMRIYALGELAPPEGADGQLRASTAADADLVLAWIEGFHRDTGEASVVDDETHRARIEFGGYRLWCVDGEPVSMCACSEPLEGMSRVFAVYTPPGLRGRSHAAAGVAALSAEILAQGANAMLFTDLGNPTSNKVYRRIGYRAVAENLRYDFS
jgi:uncharacterized protein